MFFERIEENNVKKDHRDSFSHYYEEAYKKIIEMSRNNDYTTGNFLDFAYFKENYRLTATDLSKQTKLKDPQQISFNGKLKVQNIRATMFFIMEKSEETTHFYKIL